MNGPCYYFSEWPRILANEATVSFWFLSWYVCKSLSLKTTLKNDKIARTDLKTEIKPKPNAFITEVEIWVINLKRYLTLKEAAVLINISPFTLRRWTLAGKMNSHKVGKKWILDVKQIQKIISFKVILCVTRFKNNLQLTDCLMNLNR